MIRRPAAYAAAVAVPVVLVLGGAWLLGGGSPDVKAPAPVPAGARAPIGGDAQVAQLVADGQAAYASGDLDGAESAFASAQALAPDSTWIAFDLGTVADAGGDRAQAMAWYVKALELDPANVQANFNLALDQAAAGDPEAAQRSYAAVLASDPQHANALWNLGLLMYEQGDRAEARGLLRQAVDIDGSLLTRLPANVRLQ